MGILMCEICGQRFHKVSELYCHQMGTHKMEYKQLHKSTELNIAVFSYLSNVSICDGGNGRVLNSDGVTLDQSVTADHHIFSGIDTLDPLFFMSAQQIDDCWEATMANYANRQEQINRGTDSQESNIVMQLNTMSWDVRAKDAMMNRFARKDSSAIPLNLQRATNGSTNDPTAPGDNPEPSCRVCTNYVPKGSAILPQGTKSATGTQQKASLRNVPDPTISTVSAIIQNLKAMKSLNNQICDQLSNSKKMSLRQLNSLAYTPTFTRPLNLSEFDKRVHKEEIIVKHQRENEVVPKRNDELSGLFEHSSQPAQHFVAVPEGRGEIEKVPTFNKTLKHKNGFFTSQLPSKRCKGIYDSPTQLYYGEVLPSTSSIMGTNKKLAETAATVSVAGSGVELVGKATAPTSKAIEGREKVPPQEVSPNLANGLNPIQPSAKYIKRVKRNGKSTKLVHKRVVSFTSSIKVSYGGMKVTLAKLKKIVPTMPGTNYIMPDMSGVSWFTGDWGKQFWICLVCSQVEPDESSKDMICCDECDNWYHFECVGIMGEVAEEDPWYCKICIYKISGNKKSVFPEIFKND